MSDQMYQLEDAPVALALPKKRIRPIDVQMAVADKYKVTVADLVGRGAQPRFSFPRQVAMTLVYRLKKNTSTYSWSYKRTGNYFGNRDHTTVIYAVKKIEKLCQTDSVLCQIVAEIYYQFES